MLLLAMRTMPRAAESASIPSRLPIAFDCFACRVHVGGQFAAAEIVAVDSAEPQICVGCGGVNAAVSVGGGTRYGTGGLGADMQLSELIDPCN